MEQEQDQEQEQDEMDHIKFQLQLQNGRFVMQERRQAGEAVSWVYVASLDER